MANIILVQQAFAAGDAAVWPSERTAIAIGAIFLVIGIAMLGLTRRKT